MGINQFGDGMFSEIIEASTKGERFNFFSSFAEFTVVNVVKRYTFTVLQATDFYCFYKELYNSNTFILWPVL